MAEDILSQGEIDALLSAIHSGEMDAEELKKEEEQKVTEYDFKRALRFSKDQIRSISRIHENYARLLTTFFSGKLRSYVDISVASVDQVPYEEFIWSIPEMTILNVYDVPPLEGSILLEINPNIAFSMMERLLGGKESNRNHQPSDLTEIESSILSQLFDSALGNLEEAWSVLADIEPALQEFEINPQFLQMVSPNETVVVVTLDTQIGEVSGMINICIPHVVLEPIIPKLSMHHWMQTGIKKRDQTSFEQLTNHMKEVEVEAKTLLGEATISLRDLLYLHTDDVITLNQPIERPLQLVVNDEPKMVVQPGRIHKKLAVQILGDIKGGT